MNETATDLFWDDLLQYIETQKVIPIIGRELLVIEVDGRRMLLENYLAERLAALYGITSGETASVCTLNQVACSIVNKGNRRQEIYLRINTILSEGRILIPESLCKLALITHFILFFTTFFDWLLEEAIC